MEISNLTYPPTYLTYQGISTRGCNFSPVPPSRRPRTDVRAGKLRVRGKAAGTRGAAAAAYPSFKHNTIYMLEIPIGLYSISVCVCVYYVFDEMWRLGVQGRTTRAYNTIPGHVSYTRQNAPARFDK